jgi:hypothetical protein
MGLSFTIPAGPRQCSHSQIRVPRDSRSDFTVLDSRLPQPGGPGPRINTARGGGGGGGGRGGRRAGAAAGGPGHVLIQHPPPPPPPNRLAQLCTQALHYIFVATYDSQGYGEGLQTCLHMRSGFVETLNNLYVYLYYGNEGQTRRDNIR